MLLTFVGIDIVWRLDCIDKARRQEVAVNFHGGGLCGYLPKADLIQNYYHVWERIWKYENFDCDHTDDDDDDLAFGM